MERLPPAKAGPSGPAAAAAVQHLNDLISEAKSAWVILITFLAFIAITTMGVEDADFFTNSKQTQLPLVGVSIPTSLLFYIAPALAAGLYMHFSFLLRKLWRDLIRHEALGPAARTGPPVKPWFLADLIREDPDGRRCGVPSRRCLRRITVFSGFFLPAPLILGVMWWRSMPKHDEAMTVLFCGVPFLIAVAISLRNMGFVWGKLRGTGRDRAAAATARRGRGAVLVLLSVAVTAYGWIATEGTLKHYAFFTGAYHRAVEAEEERLGELTAEAFEAETGRLHSAEAIPEEAERDVRSRWWMKTWAPRLLASADLAGVRFTALPGDWKPHDEAERAFRAAWCAGQGLDKRICGPGSFAATGDPEALAAAREAWCRDPARAASGDPALCRNDIAAAEARYAAEWTAARSEQIRKLPRTDLDGADLRGAHLYDAGLDGASLYGARLEGANLSAARLEGAILTHADLECADISYARLDMAEVNESRMRRAYGPGSSFKGARLWWTRLSGANLRGAAFQSSDLYAALLDHADLSGVNAAHARLRLATLDHARLSYVALRGSDLVKASLRNTNLWRADLRDSWLFEARLDRAKLVIADLRGSRLQAAILTDANLSMADLRDAVLTDAWLDGANLTRTRFGPRAPGDLVLASLRNAAVRGTAIGGLPPFRTFAGEIFGDASVQRPEQMDLPTHWPDRELGYEEFQKAWQDWRGGRTPARAEDRAGNEARAVSDSGGEPPSCDWWR